MEKGDGTRAESTLREALRHQPEFAESHSNLGQLLAAKRDYQQAEFHLREAVRRKPDRSTAWNVLGEVQSVQGNWARAKGSSEATLRLKPGDEVALLGCGTALAAMGDITTNLTKAASGRNAPIRAEAVELLGKLR